MPVTDDQEFGRRTATGIPPRPQPLGVALPNPAERIITRTRERSEARTRQARGGSFRDFLNPSEEETAFAGGNTIERRRDDAGAPARRLQAVTQAGGPRAFGSALQTSLGAGLSQVNAGDVYAAAQRDPTLVADRDFRLRQVMIQRQALQKKARELGVERYTAPNMLQYNIPHGAQQELETKLFGRPLTPKEQVELGLRGQEGSLGNLVPGGVKTLAGARDWEDLQQAGLELLGTAARQGGGAADVAFQNPALDPLAAKLGIQNPAEALQTANEFVQPKAVTAAGATLATLEKVRQLTAPLYQRGSAGGIGTEPTTLEEKKAAVDSARIFGRGIVETTWPENVKLLILTELTPGIGSIRGLKGLLKEGDAEAVRLTANALSSPEGQVFLATREGGNFAAQLNDAIEKVDQGRRFGGAEFLPGGEHPPRVAEAPFNPQNPLQRLGPQTGPTGLGGRAAIAGVGAGAGATQGDTPQERFRNALIGAGLGTFAADVIVRSGIADNVMDELAADVASEGGQLGRRFPGRQVSKDAYRAAAGDPFAKLSPEARRAAERGPRPELDLGEAERGQRLGGEPITAGPLRVIKGKARDVGERLREEAGMLGRQGEEQNPVTPEDIISPRAENADAIARIQRMTATQIENMLEDTGPQLDPEMARAMGDRLQELADDGDEAAIDALERNMLVRGQDVEKMPRAGQLTDEKLERQLEQLDMREMRVQNSAVPDEDVLDDIARRRTLIEGELERRAVNKEGRLRRAFGTLGGEEGKLGAGGAEQNPVSEEDFLRREGEAAPVPRASDVPQERDLGRLSTEDLTQIYFERRAKWMVPNKKNPLTPEQVTSVRREEREVVDEIMRRAETDDDGVARSFIRHEDRLPMASREGEEITPQRPRFEPTQQELDFLENAIRHGDWTTHEGGRAGAMADLRALQRGENISDKQLGRLKRALNWIRAQAQGGETGALGKKTPEGYQQLLPDEYRPVGLKVERQVLTGISNSLNAKERMAQWLTFPIHNKKDIALAAIQLPRTLTTAIDIGWGGRNGWRLFPRNPREWFRMYGRQYTALASEDAYNALQSGVVNSKRFHVWQNLDEPLAFLERGTGDIEKTAETAMSRFTQDIPILRQSERAYIAPGNAMRYEVADKIADVAERNLKRPLTREEFQAIASNINSATLRGSTKFLGPDWAKVASSALFSAKGVVSGPQFVAQGLKALGDTSISGVVRREIAYNVGSYIAMGMMTMSAAALAGYQLRSKKPGFVNVDLNWRSDQLAQIEVGGVRWNYWGSDQPLVKQILQQFQASYAAKGVSTEQLGKAMNFGRSKVAPGAPSFAFDFFARKGVGYPLGENLKTKEGLLQYGRRQVSPIFIDTGTEAYKDVGPIGAVVAVLADLNGLTTQTFEPVSTNTLSSSGKKYLNRAGGDYHEAIRQAQLAGADDDVIDSIEAEAHRDFVRKTKDSDLIVEGTVKDTTLELAPVKRIWTQPVEGFQTSFRDDLSQDVGYLWEDDGHPDLAGKAQQAASQGETQAETLKLYVEAMLPDRMQLYGETKDEATQALKSGFNTTASQNAYDKEAKYQWEEFWRAHTDWLRAAVALGKPTHIDKDVRDELLGE